MAESLRQASTHSIAIVRNSLGEVSGAVLALPGPCSPTRRPGGIPHDMAARGRGGIPGVCRRCVRFQADPAVVSYLWQWAHLCRLRASMNAWPSEQITNLVEYRVRDGVGVEPVHLVLDMAAGEVVVTLPSGGRLAMSVRLARAVAACLVPATYGSWEADWRAVEVNLGDGWVTAAAWPS